ncbi:hypothetical protein [Methanoregula sp.]|jgi:hypothetical protein|uniref:hypothetical protein n=1 Tax=Methanoregula sp. TaxID=2052170 RepID=UPI003C793759
MDSASVKKWAIFFAGILCAALIANALSTVIIGAAQLTGAAGFIISFVLYAVFFFGVLYIIEKITGVTFFRFSYD